MSRGLVSLFLIAGHALAAEPGATNPPPKSAPAAAPKVPDAPPKAGDAPPPEYYVEPSAPPDGAPPGGPAPDSGPPGPPGPPPPPPSDPNAVQIYEPQPPGFEPLGAPVFEPPPPPEPHHIAPRTSLWLGARVGWFIPFGSAWARGTPPDSAGNVSYRGVPWSDYVSSGPMFELDAGARLSRSYTVFAIWEHAELGSGGGDPGGSIGKSKSGDTDFWGVGIRATSDPDRVGFITELAIGWRQARAKYDDGSEIQFTQAPFEARLGLGAEFRLNEYVTLSPMATLGVGSFGNIERKTATPIPPEDDEPDGHAWATLTFGGNFDLLGSKR